MKAVLGEKVPLERYRESLKVLMQEMSKYPPEMIRKVAEGRGLRVRILHDLRDKYKDAAGNVAIRRWGGIALFLKPGKAAEFIVDAEESPQFQAGAIHHELNHRFAEKWQERHERDKKWRGFHKQVSPNPYRRIPPGSAHQPAKEAYFLSNYAGTSPVEDQAVTAEWMMTPRLIVEFIDRWNNEKDPRVKDILAKKYAETKRNYHEWSGGVMGELYWQAAINEGRREQERAQ